MSQSSPQLLLVLTPQHAQTHTREQGMRHTPYPLRTTALPPNKNPSCHTLTHGAKPGQGEVIRIEETQATQRKVCSGSGHISATTPWHQVMRNSTGIYFVSGVCLARLLLYGGAAAARLRIPDTRAWLRGRETMQLA